MTDNPYTQTHVVQSGDTLSKIAQKYYGDRVAVQQDLSRPTATF